MRMHLSNLFLLLTWWSVLSLGSPVLGQNTKPQHGGRNIVAVTPQPTVTPKELTPDEQRRQDTFIKVWQTINTNYFDSTFSGLDWNAIRNEYQPRVAAAKTDTELHHILAEMISRLGKSHFAIIPPEYLKTIRQARAEARAREREMSGAREPGAGEPEHTDNEVDLLIDDPNAIYGIGIDLKLIDGRFVVFHVDKQSTAYIAGLKPGYVIDKINGVSLTDLINRILITFPDVHGSRHLPLQIVAGILNGEPDTSVFLTCLDENDQPHEFKVSRIALSGDSVSVGMRLPLQFLQYQALSLDDDIGYVKFNIFAIPVIDKFCTTLTEFASKKAIIIDLRGNVGGVLGTMIGLTGMMSDKLTTIGTTRYRSGSEALKAEPKKKRFEGRVVFLVDNESVSAAEIFAASMQDNHRAIIVGDHTAGEALPSVTSTLATGAVLVYPIGNFITPNGRSIEGTGVEPDFPVKLDRASLLKGVDTQLDKAVSLIRSGAAPLKPREMVNGGPTVPPPLPPAPARSVALPKASRSVGVKPVFKLERVGHAAKSPSTTSALKRDAAAVKVIDDFINAIGGREELLKINSYSASGHGLISFRGIDTEVDVHAWRRTPDKFTLLMSSPALGETREIYNSGTFYLQSDFGADNRLQLGPELNRTHLFSAIFDLLDPNLFASLTFEGRFAVGGRTLNVITARSAYGLTAGFSFDDETKMLVRYAPPGFTYAFRDYRNVGKVLLPFQIDMDPMMRIRFDSINANEEVDPSIFERKEKCFDKETK